jgi:hypothetical protein
MRAQGLVLVFLGVQGYLAVLGLAAVSMVYFVAVVQ